MLRIDNLLDLDKTIAKDLFEGRTYPWEVLDDIKAFIIRLGERLSPEDYYQLAADVWVARDAVIAPTASITGPCIIDAGAEVRHGAFIRGSAIVGKGCVVGNSTELKNVVLFDYVQVPHYNYVGDSVLGHKAHMGAGAVTSNVKSDRSLVVVRSEDMCIETGRKKLGAILGDFAEIGCNAVLNPGTVIGRHANVYPLSCVRGTVPANHIYKGEGQVVRKR